MPLLFQDKLNIIEKYLAKSPKMQKLFVEYLDMMCAKESHISTYLQ